jgi:hypothetical protein
MNAPKNDFRPLCSYGKWLEGENNPATAKYAGLYDHIARYFGELRAQSGIYGSYSTGVISHADMAANEQGYKFYNNLYNAFVANPMGPAYTFSATKYAINAMNEQSNPNTFVNGVKVDDKFEAIQGPVRR